MDNKGRLETEKVTKVPYRILRYKNDDKNNEGILLMTDKWDKKPWYRFDNGNKMFTYCLKYVEAQKRGLEGGQKAGEATQ